jgi:hypothetical protein
VGRITRQTWWKACLLLDYHCLSFYFTPLLHIHTDDFHWQIQVPSEQTPKFCLNPKNEITFGNELIRSWHRTLMSSWRQPRAENVNSYSTPTCLHTVYLMVKWLTSKVLLKLCTCLRPIQESDVQLQYFMGYLRTYICCRLFSVIWGK